MATLPCLHSSRPVPVFDQDCSFTQRKRTPFRTPRPPQAPSKSCPPVSRIFPPEKYSVGPQLVSFKSEKKLNVLNSPHYNSHSNKSYFEQCFQIHEKLGEGSFGEVYRVSSCDDGKMYAIKKSRQQFRGERDRRRKLAEVERHEHLPHHPNCVKFHMAWEECHRLYIQTELCHMSLAEYADLHGTIPEQRIWHMLVDLTKGLKHLHDNRLCHFDIKSANIFLADDNLTCKLGDFGLCTNLDQEFRDAMEGDARYMAPELMRHDFGKPADIFSLGITLLELACDIELPSGGENWHKLRSGEFFSQITQNVSPGLMDILSRMMHPDPKLRPTVDQILADHCIALALASYEHSCFKACAEKFSTRKEKFESSSEGSFSFQNESLTNNEDELLHYTLSHTFADDGSDPSAKFNRSWIRHSPMRYPNKVYAGPPIPLDFADSSSSDKECSPYSTPIHSPCQTMSSSPSIVDRPKERTSIEPKCLMEAFSDTSD